MERKTRFELATPSLARRCSTTEPLPLEPCGPLMFNTCSFVRSRLKVPWYTHPPKPFEPGVLLVLPRYSSRFFLSFVSRVFSCIVASGTRLGRHCRHKSGAGKGRTYIPDECDSSAPRG